jgi:hypothetical protein
MRRRNGESIGDFLDRFPSVKHEQVIAITEAGLIREARETDADKPRFTVNELRAQRGLAKI